MVGQVNVSSDESGDSQTELEASSGIVASGAVDAAGGGPLGLQLVFPELRPEAVAPTAGVPLVLGRDGDGDGRLSGSEISRRHGELRVAGDRLVLRDLDSSNGLFVNGARCPEAALVLGDVVRMGEWVGVVVPLQAAPVVDDLHLGPIARPVVLRAARVARTRLPVLIEGETGTGKERLARAIHEWSERPGPFIALDSATLTGPQAEGELFAQHGGSLFLDEVTHLPPESQPLLLRALAAVAGESPPGAGPGAPDVRLLAATRVPLAGAVAERGFLPELQARLERFTLRLPPLRERRADVLALFVHLLAQHGLVAPELSTRLVEALCAYDWPFNVRELDHLTEQLTLLHGQEPMFRRSHLPDRIRYYRSGPPPPGEPSRQVILSELTATGGNLARASQRLGISRQDATRILEDDSR